MKNEISIIKIVAMFMIIGCHLSEWLGINIIAMVLNVGVEIFLFVSGYLYSNRNIGKTKNFLVKKFLKICIPTYIAFIILAIANILIFRKSYFNMTPVYLLNLQGINFIINKISLPVLDSLGQLWFMTAIFINYLLLAVVKKYEKNTFWMDNKKVFVTFVVSFFIAIALVFSGIHMCYTFIFFVGYAYGKNETKMTGIKYIILTSLMILAMCGRIIARRYFDGSILYNDIIAIYTHMILGTWIILTIQFFYCKNKKVIDKICETRIWKTLNAYTMPIYLSHYPFLAGNFNVSRLGFGIGIELAIFVIATIALAYLIKQISCTIYRIASNRTLLMN